MRSLTLVPILLATASTQALALDFGSGFYATGEVELEYFDSTSGSGSGDTFGYASVDLGFEQQGGGFGAFVGLDAVSIDDDDVSAVYGALTYSGSFGKIQIGAPRAALDDYIDTPEIGGLRVLDFGELGVITGSIVPFVTLTMVSDTPIGLRYDGTFGAAKVGASVHRIDDGAGDNIDVYDLGMNYQLGQTVLRAGLEHLRGNGDSATDYFLGAETSFGKVDAGVMLSSLEFIGDANAVKLYATYSPIEALDLTASYVSISSSGSSDDLYGLNADYTFSQGVFVQAGIADGSNISGVLYNLSLGAKF